VLRVALEIDTPDPAPVPWEDAELFVRGCPGLRARDRLLRWIAENRDARPFLPEHLNNLCVEERALTARSASALARWMSRRGTRFLVSHARTLGHEREEWMVVFDTSAVLSADPVRAAEADRLRAGGGGIDLPPFSEQFAVFAAPSATPTRIAGAVARRSGPS